VRAVALIRYLTADALRAERWVAPGVLFLLVTIARTPDGGNALGGYGLTAAVLLPIAIWMSITISNSEDPIQTAITVVTVGSALVVRIGKLALAYLTCVVLAAIGVVWPLLTGHPAGPADILAGVAGHLLTALAGVGFGSLLTRPVLRTPAWVVLIGLTFCVLEFLAPGLPPVRPVAILFAADAPAPHELTRSLSLIAIETLALTAVLVGAGHVLARRRT
jgi:hypothetical protein